jgi:hypothetical protein
MRHITKARRAGVAVMLGALLVFGMAGCFNSSDEKSSPRNNTSKDDGVAFARCMREHGIDMEDPQSGEGINIPDGYSKEQIDTAREACRDLLPGGGEPPKLDPEEIERQLAYSKCMREHGVPNFPDPDENGRLNLGDQVDPMNPTFQDAQHACARYSAPGGDLSIGGN